MSSKDMKNRPEGSTRDPPTSDINVLRDRLRRDPRFNPPTPSIWKRIALLITVVFLFYFAVKMRVSMVRPNEPEVVHATRYSKEYKFRPAASPVITEQLNDGRVRVRGAHPTIR